MKSPPVPNPVFAPRAHAILTDPNVCTCGDDNGRRVWVPGCVLHGLAARFRAQVWSTVMPGE